MSTEVKSNGTADMPHPPTIAYEKRYLATGNFLKDLEIALADMPYIDAYKYFDMLSAHNNIFTIAVLNEFLSMLGTAPFKYVAEIMSVLRSADTFGNYFVEMTEE